MPTRNSKSGAPPVYRTKPLQPHVGDSYKSRAKPHEPTACPECSAVFHEGRWQWLPAPASAHREMCPACHRIRDNMPAGYVKLEGAFLAQHRGEILSLVRNVEGKEKPKHPMQRIMKIVDEDGKEMPERKEGEIGEVDEDPSLDGDHPVCLSLCNPKR